MLPNIIKLNDRKCSVNDVYTTVKRVIPSELVTDDIMALIKQLWGKVCHLAHFHVVLKKGGT